MTISFQFSIALETQAIGRNPFYSAGSPQRVKLGYFPGICAANTSQLREPACCSCDSGMGSEQQQTGDDC